MTHDLPRRPYREQPPPADGLSAIRTEAGRRRRRKAVAASASSVLGVAAVVVVLLASGEGSPVTLHQLPPAGVTGEPTEPPGPSFSPSPSVFSSPSGAPASPPSPAEPVTSATTEPRSTPPGSPAPAATYRTPDLSRQFIAASGRPRECSGAFSQSDVHAQLGWCVTAVVTPTAAGHHLTVDVCRDSTGASSLTFTGTDEVDLVVSAGNREVWRWSADHPARSDGHSLSTPANACWDWTADWTDVDGQGRRLAPGSYTFTAESLSEELRSLPGDQTTFTV